MKYMLTIYNNPATVDSIYGADRDEFRKVHGELQEELTASGKLVDSNEQSQTDARVVRSVDGNVDVTAGPVSPAGDFAGGYYIVDVAGADEAIAIAARFVEARHAPVEVRALVH